MIYLCPKHSHCQPDDQMRMFLSRPNLRVI